MEETFGLKFEKEQDGYSQQAIFCKKVLIDSFDLYAVFDTLQIIRITDIRRVDEGEALAMLMG